jgi:N6-adenosine-specific RNA methylase IME4
VGGRGRTTGVGGGGVNDKDFMMTTVDVTADDARRKALQPIVKAHRILAEAKTLDDFLQVENLAQRARDFAKAAGLGRKTMNEAARIMLDARRQAGLTLVAMKERGELAARGGDRKSNSQPASLKLEDLGITHSQSARYQQEASVSEEQYRMWVDDVLSSDDRELSAAQLRKFAKRTKAPETTAADEPVVGVYGTLHELVDEGHKFSCIYADPPWRYGNQGTRAATDDHYPTMTVEEICAEPVACVSADECHLYLWTTTSFLRDAFNVIDAWGFEYKSNMVWVKPQMGIGNYVRVSHEHLLIGVKGKTRTAGSSQMSWIQADRTVHSRKPREFRQAIERMSQGPYLEMYGREAIDGWAVYGNQVARLPLLDE